ARAPVNRRNTLLRSPEGIVGGAEPHPCGSVLRGGTQVGVQLDDRLAVAATEVGVPRDRERRARSVQWKGEDEDQTQGGNELDHAHLAGLPAKVPSTCHNLLYARLWPLASPPFGVEVRS